MSIALNGYSIFVFHSMRLEEKGHEKGLESSDSRFPGLQGEGFDMRFDNVSINGYSTL